MQFVGVRSTFLRYAFQISLPLIKSPWVYPKVSSNKNLPFAATNCHCCCHRASVYPNVTSNNPALSPACKEVMLPLKESIAITTFICFSFIERLPI